jgi:hypothetical protein
LSASGPARENATTLPPLRGKGQVTRDRAVHPVGVTGGTLVLGSFGGVVVGVAALRPGEEPLGPLAAQVGDGFGLSAFALRASADDRGLWPEVTNGKGPAAAGLEVRLEVPGLGRIVEPDPDFAFPRAELVSSGRLTCVVLCQSSIEILCQADIPSPGVLLAPDQIDPHRQSSPSSAEARPFDSEGGQSSPFSPGPPLGNRRGVSAIPRGGSSSSRPHKATSRCSFSGYLKRAGGPLQSYSGSVLARRKPM